MNMFGPNTKEVTAQYVYIHIHIMYLDRTAIYLCILHCVGVLIQLIQDVSEVSFPQCITLHFNTTLPFTPSPAKCSPSFIGVLRLNICYHFSSFLEGFTLDIIMLITLP
jgi:hypothetical protein